MIIDTNTDIDALIQEWKHEPMWHHLQGLSYTASGYGNRIPTEWMVRIEQKWYRLNCKIFSNFGTTWINYQGRPRVVRTSFPEAGLTAFGIRVKILAGMASAYFCCAWADECEEKGHSSRLSGKEITEIAPAVADPAAVRAAVKLADFMEKLHDATLPELFRRHSHPKLDYALWGHYAAMQAMGHGVGLSDYNIGIAIPYVGSVELDKEYFKQPRKER